MHKSVLQSVLLWNLYTLKVWLNTIKYNMLHRYNSAAQIILLAGKNVLMSILLPSSTLFANYWKFLFMQ